MLASAIRISQPRLAASIVVVKDEDGRRCNEVGFHAFSSLKEGCMVGHRGLFVERCSGRRFGGTWYVGGSAGSSPDSGLGST
jgi:predicted ATP-grasp superfamily ATP-dependent carboligase